MNCPRPRYFICIGWRNGAAVKRRVCRGFGYDGGMGKPSGQDIGVRLEYQTPVGRIELPSVWRATCFRIGLFCWIIPLFAGVFEFLAWVCFRFKMVYLIEAGILTILMGTLLAGIGGIAALVLLATRWSESSRPLRQAGIARNDSVGTACFKLPRRQSDHHCRG